MRQLVALGVPSTLKITKENPEGINVKLNYTGATDNVAVGIASVLSKIQVRWINRIKGMEITSFDGNLLEMLLGLSTTGYANALQNLARTAFTAAGAAQKEIGEHYLLIPFGTILNLDGNDCSELQIEWNDANLQSGSMEIVSIEGQGAQTFVPMIRRGVVSTTGNYEVNAPARLVQAVMYKGTTIVSPDVVGTYITSKEVKVRSSVKNENLQVSAFSGMALAINPFRTEPHKNVPVTLYSGSPATGMSFEAEWAAEPTILYTTAETSQGISQKAQSIVSRIHG